MMEAAVSAAGALPHRPSIIAVTVLTSSAAPLSAVEELAGAAIQAGCAGVVVAGGDECRAIRAKWSGAPIVVFAPGIRIDGMRLRANDDQMRVATPEEALASGATFLVVGRALAAVCQRLDAACGPRRT